jgi:hypothetical protein
MPDGKHLHPSQSRARRPQGLFLEELPVDALMMRSFVDWIRTLCKHFPRTASVP